MSPLPECDWDLPDPRKAPAGEEMLAVGADLEPLTLIAAYSRGLFPMDVGRDGPLGWWSPDPRGVLPLDGLRATRSLRASSRRYRVTIDMAFDEVMSGCADQRRAHGWITSAFQAAYSRMHALGYAHSVETWLGDDLVGGLYGIEIGGLFAGESMFHRARDASKVALVSLVDALGGAGAAADGRLLDVQWPTPHLESLGVVAIPRHDYLRRLETARALPPKLGANGLSGSERRS
jgi:leucyl/phenylalanyl-tRNA--protein transferase